MPLELSSSAFSHNEPIPQEHTCDGADEPPPLQWDGVPAAAETLALIVDDPDAPDPEAPQRTYVHWVVYDVPASATSLAGGREGKNDWNRTGYGGPCPPIGRHRYFFKLYALDTRLGNLGEPTKAELEEAMRDHVLEQAELMGTYERAGS
jgi:hypothetical protein